jgi:hypothetical protein
MLGDVKLNWKSETASSDDHTVMTLVFIEATLETLSLPEKSSKKKRQGFPLYGYFAKVFSMHKTEA